MTSMPLCFFYLSLNIAGDDIYVLLSHYSVGVKCAVLEKNRVFSQHPQAHFINNRTMEVSFLYL